MKIILWFEMHLIQSFKQYIDSSLKLQVIHYKMSRWNYSYGLNILRVFDFWRNICFTTTKKSLIISANHDIFELSQEMPRDVRLRILDLSLPPKIFFNSSKKPLKNRNWTFPVVCYFTWKMEFVSNVLSMIVHWKCKSQVLFRL